MKTLPDNLPADVSMYVGPRAPRVPVIDVREGEHPPHSWLFDISDCPCEFDERCEECAP